ncbi:hypothetical protein [Runella sp. SP2]|nr:hypothetical protein [Runella sp. SP2]
MRIENGEAANLALSSEKIEELTKASKEVRIIGARYTEAMEKSTGL